MGGRRAAMRVVANGRGKREAYKKASRQEKKHNLHKCTQTHIRMYANHTRIHTQTHTCTRRHTDTAKDTDTQTHPRTCIHRMKHERKMHMNSIARMCTCLDSHKHAMIHARAHTNTRRHARAHAHTHKHTRTHTHTRIHTHTHTQSHTHAHTHFRQVGGWCLRR